MHSNTFNAEVTKQQTLADSHERSQQALDNYIYIAQRKSSKILRLENILRLTSASWRAKRLL